MKIRITSEADMKKFGARLGRLAKGGETIELIGDIGAGKTTFTKGLAVGMGITETVQSPTFTISRVYDAPDGRVLSHYDFYRLADAGIMADELAEASQQANVIVVIEWGDIVREVLPSDYLQILFTSPAETVRELTLSAQGPHSRRLLEEFS